MTKLTLNKFTEQEARELENIQECCALYKFRGEYPNSTDGKYEYKYLDGDGERRSVYSWKLVATDPLPKGKHDTPALRDLEKSIQKDIEDDIQSYQAKRMTLNHFWEQYIGMKLELKESTRSNYIYMYDKYVRPEIGTIPIDNFKYSDIKRFYMSLIHEKGFKPNSMEIVHTILHPVFTTPKTKAGERIIPMLKDVKEALTMEYKRQLEEGV